MNFFYFGPEIPFLEKVGLKIQNCLKLVSAIFYQIFTFHQMIAL